MVCWLGVGVFVALSYRYTTLFDGLKRHSVDLAAKLYWVSDLPQQAGDWADNRILPRERLAQENASLRSENLVLKQKIQKNASLEAENFRLRQLLSATEVLEDRVLIAELIGVSPDTQVQKVILNKGRQHQVYVGQAVLDAFGLMGQVVEVGDRYSVVLLITDTTHMMPIEVSRSGLRLLAEGTGRLYSLNLLHVATTLDVRVGDTLVSSGLGQRFPRGYPVAEVTEVSIVDGAKFATVRAKPFAQLNRSRHVLIVFETQEER